MIFTAKHAFNLRLITIKKGQQTIAKCVKPIYGQYCDKWNVELSSGAMCGFETSQQALLAFEKWAKGFYGTNAIEFNHTA